MPPDEYHRAASVERELQQCGRIPRALLSQLCELRLTLCCNLLKMTKQQEKLFNHVHYAQTDDAANNREALPPSGPRSICSEADNVQYWLKLDRLYEFCTFQRIAYDTTSDPAKFPLSSQSCHADAAFGASSVKESSKDVTVLEMMSEHSIIWSSVIVKAGANRMMSPCVGLACNRICMSAKQLI